ncbi:MoaD/ThiS family protein [Siansivirga zeaxanthinifaciens]|uniref:Molybdopterin biosynthesis protein n=1 Tax=Siansivirga zeaxanthinifaciens CC-SAMT-1 TaxID=1454006 RepID=A0A0C5WCS5_9FLAO|nr:MoaD/ThiS family protein [Siansivirga zeaxanthinifaciens]AJR04092.1 molybdopterin biosynthesis protein [Siansivirga zeaxanthinifaciens CC-SAMT-1]
MKINIKYFGQIAEVTNRDSEIIEVSAKTISELTDWIYLKFPDLKNKDFQVAQNQELVSIETKITGNEIALLPPFSGG